MHLTYCTVNSGNNLLSGPCCWAVYDGAVGCKLFWQRAEWHSFSGLYQKQTTAHGKDLLSEAAKPSACSREAMDGAVMSSAFRHSFSARGWEVIFFKNSHISPSFTFRHFQGFSVAKLSRTMTANIEKLLLSDTKSDSASRWRQDGLFNFCYSLLFRYHISSRFPFVQWKCSCC